MLLTASSTSLESLVITPDATVLLSVCHVRILRQTEHARVSAAFIVCLSFLSGGDVCRYEKEVRFKYDLNLTVLCSPIE